MAERGIAWSMTPVPTLIVDFNDCDWQRNVTAWRACENKRLRATVGMVVQLRDDDGFACSGVVREVCDDAVVVTPAWETWRNPDMVRISGEERE